MSVSELKDIDWNEIRAFIEVARAEGLAGSARRTGLSAPTLGRRMTALERRLGQRLFDRKQTGYALTDSGHALYRQALEMESAANDIRRWRDRSARRVVRITAGAWTTRFLAEHVDALWRHGENFGIEFSTTHANVDIVHRQSDIGVRARSPNDPRLVGRRIQTVAHCRYRSRGGSDDLPWIGTIGDAAIAPSARWINAHHGDCIGFVASDARVVVDLMRAGAGQGVLPCFVGDGEAALERVGSPIEELKGEQWLALNDQARHEPAVRTVIDRMTKLLSSYRALFEGERPQS